jgi:hemoglobin-like flavoprotein
VLARTEREEKMNNDQKVLVQKTFEMVAPIADVAAGLFYGRLFEVDPSLKPLFRGDVKDQGKKLMSTLKVAVHSLDRLDALIPVVQALGRRHLAYGVRDEHYDTVGACLLWTLEKGLGDAWNADVKEAWTVVYGILAKVMKDAANEVAPLSLRTPMSRRPSGLVAATKRPNFRPPIARPSGPPGSRMPSSMHSSVYPPSAAAAPSSNSGPKIPAIINPIIT